jgi:molybdenum-dependent DNA-binding transcriptional regulator ModE
MTDRVDAMNLFIRVARTRSFSVAARECGVSQPTVSRAIASLERELGVALLARTPRSVNLTEAGAAYFSRLEIALNALDEAADAVRGSGVLSGTLRIATSSSFGQRVVIPRLPGFMAAHPQFAGDPATRRSPAGPDFAGDRRGPALRRAGGFFRGRPQDALLAQDRSRVVARLLGQGRRSAKSGGPCQLPGVRPALRTMARD